jgi:shikimate kinase
MDQTIPPTGKREPTSHPSIKRIVLTGFMGSGKTTVGRLLAAQLGWSFIDLDDEIVRRHGCSIADIFAVSGELLFRNTETEALTALLRESRIVLALGGGAIETEANRDLLSTSEQTLVILLTAPFGTLYERCAWQESDPAAAVRPLLGDRDSAERRLARRNEFYVATAGLIIDTSGQTPHESVKSVVSSLQAIRSTL